MAGVYYSPTVQLSGGQQGLQRRGPRRRTCSASRASEVVECAPARRQSTYCTSSSAQKSMSPPNRWAACRGEGRIRVVVSRSVQHGMCNHVCAGRTQADYRTLDPSCLHGAALPIVMSCAADPSPPPFPLTCTSATASTGLCAASSVRLSASRQRASASRLPQSAACARARDSSCRAAA